MQEHPTKYYHKGDYTKVGGRKKEHCSTAIINIIQHNHPIFTWVGVTSLSHFHFKC